MEEVERTCYRCGETKSPEQFRRRKGRVERLCNLCSYKKQKENPNRQKTVEKYRAGSKYAQASRKAVLARRGLTIEEFETMLAEQKGLCKTCGKPETRMLNGKIKQLSVDHCHISDKVRGLLCDDCNVALGRVKDSIEVLKNMIMYLEDAG